MTCGSPTRAPNTRRTRRAQAAVVMTSKQAGAASGDREAGDCQAGDCQTGDCEGLRDRGHIGNCTMGNIANTAWAFALMG